MQATQTPFNIVYEIQLWICGWASELCIIVVESNNDNTTIAAEIPIVE
jgi:hypothetical protein